MIEQITLEKFTVFEHLKLNVSPGINVIIGPNGVGKTHLLKIIYTVLSAINEDKYISDKIVGVFLPKERRIGRLVKRARGRQSAKVKIKRNGETLGLSFTNQTKETLKWNNGWKNQKVGRVVYIPVKEMLANAPGFLSLYNSREIHFEEVYADILHKAFVPPLRGKIGPDRKKLLDLIQKNIQGKVVRKEEQFYLKNKQGDLEFTLLAEGMRKLGLLWILIQNGTLLKGSTLFWDEPEANLNPAMLETVVEILLQLSRNGVQIFLATHNYVLLKEFDLKKKGKDKVKFFSLEFSDETREVISKAGENYIDIVPNQISWAYSNIYDEEIKRSLGDI